MVDMRSGHPNMKDLRRDQLLDNYDAAVETLRTLIKAKESEISYRTDLIEMLQKSKTVYDSKLEKVKQDYHNVKKQIPSNLDLTTSSNTNKKAAPPEIKSESSSSLMNTSNSSSSSSPPPPTASSTASSDSRTSLDRRLSEFLKTFPNLTQAGLAPTADNDAKPLPGYYTQQQPAPAPMPMVAPPLMAMMRFPPPPIPIPVQMKQVRKKHIKSKFQ